MAEEFSDWQDRSRRIDLLCLDTDANLVVVELKRTNDAGHMELQATQQCLPRADRGYPVAGPNQ
jgi:RecB family endonuclease NucS